MKMTRTGSPHKKCACGKQIFNSSSGQVTIESTVAIIAIFIFLLGATQIFLWMNRNIILRQKAYEATRVNLGHERSIEFNFAPEKLYVFPQEKQ